MQCVYFQGPCKHIDKVKDMIKFSKIRKIISHHNASVWLVSSIELMRKMRIFGLFTGDATSENLLKALNFDSIKRFINQLDCFLMRYNCAQNSSNKRTISMGLVDLHASSKQLLIQIRTLLKKCLRYFYQFSKRTFYLG